MAEALTRGVKSTVTTLVRSKNSGYGGNNGGFVGGLEEKSTAYIGRIPVIFKKIRDADGAISRKDFDEALDAAFALLLNRQPYKDEYEEHYVDVYQKNESLGNEMALQAVLIYITLSPEFVYRMELGMGGKDEHGRRLLSPQELVYAIHPPRNRIRGDPSSVLPSPTGTTFRRLPRPSPPARILTSCGLLCRLPFGAQCCSRVVCQHLENDVVGDDITHVPRGARALCRRRFGRFPSAPSP